MKTRKNALYLSNAERDNFLEAVLTLKNTIANPAAAPADRISIYDQFVAVHMYVSNMNVPGGGININMAHANAAFCPWHRYFLLKFELALQNAVGDPNLMLPYWDWTDQTGTQNVIFQGNFMGPNGGAGGAGGGTVQSGYFAFNAPGALPPWWPAGLLGFRLRTSLTSNTTLRRSLGAFATLPTQTNVNDLLGKTQFESVGQFRPTLEALPLHNFIHGWVGGSMIPLTSPNDPIFFMHHCNVDRLWAMWQIDGHQGAAFYPAAGEPEGHKLNDLMWPWVGAAAGYSPAEPLPNIILPNFAAEPQIRPADVLNHHALGFSYDTEPIIGLALDQTGSMLGMTPDPLTGMPPNINKWNAAKQGVSLFLQDCETAYTAREAYVTAGVQTFRSLGVNQFVKIFAPGTPYGLIKSGTPFSKATFDTNILAQAPSGGTPIAAALTDTENTLVRPPFGNLPATQQRYMAILTDGIETAPPGGLAGIPAGSIANTVIFAMGFGIGGGWDGVDYGTLANIVTKGKDDPNVPNQVFHGENAAVIDKFYTESLATSIGYTPGSDPIFDMFPGDHLHYTFEITDAENSFMIAAQGYDFTDRNWNFCVMGPDGVSCCDSRTGHHEEESHEDEEGNEHEDGHEHTDPVLPSHHAGHDHGDETETPPVHDHAIDCPYFLTERKENGRFTVFINRNGTKAGKWVGVWSLMVMYKMSSKNKEVMVMPYISNLLLPVGAQPLKGPVYSRYNLPAEKRLTTRLLPGRPAHRFAIGLAAPSTLNITDPCALSVQIYHRTTLRPQLKPDGKIHFAGDDIVLNLNIDPSPGANFTELFAFARLVAPAYSTGNFFADLKTIPLDQRQKYINREGLPAFNEIAYLADYELINPGVFKLRDEEISLQRSSGNSMRLKIGGNVYPGLYHVAVHLEGYIKFPYNECCHDKPQIFTRILHTTVAIGIRPDARRSRPLLFWTAPNQFTLSVTPTDKLGNVIAPARTQAPIVRINGKEIKGVFENLYTGELRLHFTFKCENEIMQKNAESFPSNAIISDDFNRIEIRKDKRLQIEITVGTTTMRVELPVIIGDTQTMRAYPAASSEAMKIEIQNRVAFVNEKRAIAAGYSL